MIIALANSKGGVGKTSISVHLAAWLAARGHSVAFADCDAQQSSSEWLAEAAPHIPAVRLADPSAILDTLPQLAQEADYVIADGPGSNTETSRALLLRADLALVPCKASMLEVRALAQATAALRQSQDIRGGLPKAVIVLSMVGKNYRLTRDMTAAAASLGLPLAATALTLRQIYADAPGQPSLLTPATRIALVGSGSRGPVRPTARGHLFGRDQLSVDILSAGADRGVLDRGCAMGAEQSKAAKRRFSDGAFHLRYFAGHGLDVGGKPDPLGRYVGAFARLLSCRTWDLEDGDAQYLAGVPAAAHPSTSARNASTPLGPRRPRLPCGRASSAFCRQSITVFGDIFRCRAMSRTECPSPRNARTRSRRAVRATRLACRACSRADGGRGSGAGAGGGGDAGAATSARMCGWNRAITRSTASRRLVSRWNRSATWVAWGAPAVAAFA